MSGTHCTITAAWQLLGIMVVISSTDRVVMSPSQGDAAPPTRQFSGNCSCFVILTERIAMHLRTLCPCISFDHIAFASFPCSAPSTVFAFLFISAHHRLQLPLNRTHHMFVKVNLFLKLNVSSKKVILACVYHMYSVVCVCLGYARVCMDVHGSCACLWRPEES